MIGRAAAFVTICLASACGDAASEDTDASSSVCDGLREDECAALASLLLPGTLPAARGNAYGEDEAAAVLGRALFFEASLGAGVSCASCHLPELAFTDRASVSTGHGTGTRNAPSVQNVARLSTFTWDGRADTAWSQAILALENPVEMASSRLALVHTVAENTALRTQYEAVFGALPDVSTLPASGGPGDAAYDTLSAASRDTTLRIVANVGKALDAFFRRNTSGPAPLDEFLRGDPDAMSVTARAGARVFVTRGCVDCHSGPMLTDEAFHVVAFPSLPGAAEDLGRFVGVERLRAGELTLASAYADPPNAGALPAPATESDRGALRTPSLRNVARTAPYGHDGALATLSEVLGAHAPETDAQERAGLIAFMQTLSGAFPPRPWAEWPSPR